MNYLEVYLCDKHTADFTFDECAHKAILKNALHVFRSKHFAVFHKQIIKIYHDNLILESSYDDINNQISPVKENVFTLQEQYLPENSLYAAISQKDTILKYYTKHTKPLHSFPSTTKIYDEMFEDKTIFKINNRLYLNFSKVTFKSESKRKYHYIYVNYNDSDKCDLKMNIKTIIDTINDLKDLLT